MALSTQINKTISGYTGSLTAEDVYVKLTSMNGSKDMIIFTVSFTKDSIPITNSKEYNFVPSMDSNFIKQAYLHLKTLPEFADATDV